MPLISRIKVVYVDDVVRGAGPRLEHFVGLIVVGLEEVLEVKEGGRLEILLLLAGGGGLGWVERSEHVLVEERRL